MQTFGKSIEEKLQANQMQHQQQQLNASKHGLGASKHGLTGSKHGIGGSKHGLGSSKHGLGGSKHGIGGNLISRLQSGSNTTAATLPTQAEENGTPSKPDTAIDPFPGPDTPFKTPAKDGEESTESTPTTPFETMAESTPNDNTSTNNNNHAKSTPLLSSRSPDEVSKEELLEILKKMNARVKALSQSRTQLAEKVKLAERDKTRLISLVKNEIVGEADYLEAMQKIEKLQSVQNKKQGGEEVVTPDEVMVLQSAWRAADERHQLNLQHIQNEYKVMTMQAQAEVEKVRKSLMEEKVRCSLPLALTLCKFSAILLFFLISWNLRIKKFKG